MTGENHFQQLKGDFLHFLHRPRLDHAVWILITKVVPAYMSRAAELEDTYRLGRACPLTSFQHGFKVNGKKKKQMPISTRTHKTDVAQWLCTCGTQELDTQAPRTCCP